VGMMMIMMVMVVGFAYKIGKSQRERERERERELVDESSRKRFGEGHERLRKMGVFLSLTPWPCLFSFLIFSSLTR